MNGEEVNGRVGKFLYDYEDAESIVLTSFISRENYDFRNSQGETVEKG